MVHLCLSGCSCFSDVMQAEITLQQQNTGTNNTSIRFLGVTLQMDMLPRPGVRGEWCSTHRITLHCITPRHITRLPRDHTLSNHHTASHDIAYYAAQHVTTSRNTNTHYLFHIIPHHITFT